MCHENFENVLLNSKGPENTSTHNEINDLLINEINGGKALELSAGLTDWHYGNEEVIFVPGRTPFPGLIKGGKLVLKPPQPQPQPQPYEWARSVDTKYVYERNNSESVWTANSSGKNKKLVSNVTDFIEKELYQKGKFVRSHGSKQFSIKNEKWLYWGKMRSFVWELVYNDTRIWFQKIEN